MAIAFAKLIVMMKDIIFLITNVKNVLLKKLKPIGKNVLR